GRNARTSSAPAARRCTSAHRTISGSGTWTRPGRPTDMAKPSSPAHTTRWLGTAASRNPPSAPDDTATRTASGGCPSTAGTTGRRRRDGGGAGYQDGLPNPSAVGCGGCPSGGRPYPQGPGLADHAPGNRPGGARGPAAG